MFKMQSFGLYTLNSSTLKWNGWCSVTYLQYIIDEERDREEKDEEENNKDREMRSGFCLTNCIPFVRVNDQYLTSKLYWMPNTRLNFPH